MQVKKKPRNAAAKKIHKVPPKEKRTKKEQTEQPLLKRVIFGEERPDLTELEAGSTTILDILAPTTVDTKSKDYIVVDGVYHTYLYITGYGYATTVGSCWLAPLVEAGEGVNMSFLVKRQSKEKILSKIAQTTMVNRSRMRDVGDTRQDYEELDSAVLVNALDFKNIRLICADGSRKRVEAVHSGQLPFPSLNEVNYLAFSEISEGYHDELYGYLEEQGWLNEYKQGKTTVSYKKINTNGTTREQQICMTEYIRHQIHHPENTYNARFNDLQLRRSIEDMRAFVTSKAQTSGTT